MHRFRHGEVRSAGRAEPRTTRAVAVCVLRGPLRGYLRMTESRDGVRWRVLDRCASIIAHAGMTCCVLKTVSKKGPFGG